MKECIMEDTQRKEIVQAALDKSKKEIPTFGHRMSISGISCLIERLSYEQYLAFLDLSNHKILEFTKEDVHATLGLPMGPSKVVEGKTCDSCEKYNAVLGSWRRRWDISSGAPKIGKMLNGILDWGDHDDEFKRDFIIYIFKAINKLITIPVEDVAAHYHEPESCNRIQVDHPLHAKKTVDDETTLSAKFKAFIQEQYLRLLHRMCARILMHPINKLRMTVSETAKKFFQQEQQSRKTA
ncbi:hypothetical protein Cgig2_009690 [Carnegiea gigantea]|uniref:Uncharacterized protein n=1 Tax=Carnegiea gigantea TaxID=171969 RepID=A0A9Q1K6K6_9CARY|nr:hypothetical protein Cgig2_009690 [Carnegiea gigantea]